MTDFIGEREAVWRSGEEPALVVWRALRDDGRHQHWLEAQGGAPGVVIVARDGDRFLLLQQERPATGRAHLGFPRGFAGGEDPEADARRELREETSLVATALSPLGSFYADSGILSGAVLAIEAEVDLDAPLALLDETEQGIRSHVVVDRRTLLDLVATGQVDDGITLAALCLHLAREEGTQGGSSPHG